jgi:hypothetical protein
MRRVPQQGSTGVSDPDPKTWADWDYCAGWLVASA